MLDSMADDDRVTDDTSVEPEVDSEVEPTTDSADGSADEKQGLAVDEVYCTSCGDPIKEKAEICPNCGVRQAAKSSDSGGNGNIPDNRLYDLQSLAQKDTTIAVLLGLLLTPGAYIYVDRTWLAVINFLTFNFFLLGFIIVPFHTRGMINDARQELSTNGYDW